MHGSPREELELLLVQCLGGMEPFDSQRYKLFVFLAKADDPRKRRLEIYGINQLECIL